MARQLEIGDTSILTRYRKLQAHWKHTSEIRLHYSYQDFASHPAQFLLVLWL